MLYGLEGETVSDDLSKLKDSVWYCDRCRQRHTCIYLKLNKIAKQNDFCPPLADVANNNVSRKEDLADDLWNNGYLPLEHNGDELRPRDYKDACEEWGKTKKSEHAEMHDRIMEMPDDKVNDLIKKGVAALAFFEISAAKSMRLLGLAERTFYRYFRGK